MFETFKKSKFYIGLALIAQSATFVMLFFVLWKKKKSLAKTFLAIAAAGGMTGAYLVYKNSKEIKREQRILAAMDAFCEDGDDFEFDENWVDLRDRAEESCEGETADNRTCDAE